MSYRDSPFAGAEIDFSPLESLGTIPERLRQRKLREAFANGLPTDENGVTDWNKAAQIIGQYSPEMASRMLNAGQLGYLNQGKLAVSQENAKPPMQQEYEFAARAGLLPPQAPQAPAPQEAPAMQLGPTGDVSSEPVGIPGYSTAQVSGVDPQRAQMPSFLADRFLTTGEKARINEGEKQAVKTGAEKPDDWSLANSSYDKFTNMENNIKKLLDPNGRATGGLRSITGKYELGGVETPIRNSWLPDVSDEAVDASNTLQTSVIQIGLNTLAEMRAVSAQGASGMGALSEKEGAKLEQSLQALQESNSTEQMETNLRQVLKHTAAVKAAIAQKFQMKHGEDFHPAPEQADPYTQSDDMAQDGPQQGTMDQEPVVTGPGASPHGNYFTGSQSAIIANIKRAVREKKMTRDQAEKILRSRGIID